MVPWLFWKGLWKKHLVVGCHRGSFCMVPPMCTSRERGSPALCNHRPLPFTPKQLGRHISFLVPTSLWNVAVLRGYSRCKIPGQNTSPGICLDILGTSLKKPKEQNKCGISMPPSAPQWDAGGLSLQLGLLLNSETGLPTCLLGLLAHPLGTALYSSAGSKEMACVSREWQHSLSIHFSQPHLSACWSSEGVKIALHPPGWMLNGIQMIQKKSSHWEKIEVWGQLLQ